MGVLGCSAAPIYSASGDPGPPDEDGLPPRAGVGSPALPGGFASSRGGPRFGDKPEPLGWPHAAFSCPFLLPDQHQGQQAAPASGEF